MLSKDAIINFFKKPEIRYILVIFFVTRIILSIIGFSSRMMLESFNVNVNNFKYSSNPVLAVWGVWDTGYYLGIAEHGYSANLGKEPMTKNQASYGFFPLYPLLIKMVNYIVHNYYLAGLFVSNICLLLAAFILYKLVKIDYDHESAISSVKYLFLFPTAFIFSGVFSESLFLLLLLLTFYLSRHKKWLAVSLSGFFLVLSRPLGILMILPIAFEYFKSKEFKIKNIDYKILYFLFWFLGLGLFLLYVNRLTGNFMGYFNTQNFGWGHVVSNPLLVISQGLFSKDIFRLLSTSIFIIFGFALIVEIKKIKFSYLLAAVLLFVFPLTTGLVALNSMLRYILPIFPFFIGLALLAKNKTSDELLIISLSLLQGFLMVFWTNGLHLIV